MIRKAITASGALSALAVVAVVAGLAGPCAAQQPAAGSVTSISPIFSELLAFQLPRSFNTVFENTREQSYIREAVLAGETVERWSQMITVTGFKDGALKPDITLRDFMERIAAGFKRACPTTFTGEMIGETKLDGREAILVLAGCGNVGDGAEARSELALLVAIKGARDIYSLQWAERGRPIATPPQFDPAVWQTRSKALHPIRICGIVPGEKAPFPSCVRQR